MSSGKIISFIGGETELQEFKAAVMGEFSITKQLMDVSIGVIYQIDSLETLYKTPKRFDKPSYFYITTQDREVLHRIKEYSINGLFSPPLKKDDVLTKLKRLEQIASSNVNSLSRQEYDSIKIKILAKAENVPPLPEAARQLIAVTGKDSATAAEVTARIKSDQGLASKVLKLINSPFYGVRGEIASIDRATILLGFHSVRNIAMALSIDSFFQKPFHMYKTTGKDMWLHSYKIACVCQGIAKELDLDQDALYMAGLMHDIGKVVMTDFLVQEVSSLEDEKNQLGLDHAEVGAIILNKWNVSQGVNLAVKNHHNIASGSIYGKVVFYADKLDHEKDNAEDIIDEMGKVLVFKNTKNLKDTIISFLREDNGE